jgi:hypothetical protein
MNPHRTLISPHSSSSRIVELAIPEEGLVNSIAGAISITVRKHRESGLRLLRKFPADGDYTLHLGKHNLSAPWDQSGVSEADCCAI